MSSIKWFIYNKYFYNGNNALKYSVATITADEYVMAGSSGGMFTEKFSNLKDSSNYLKINR